MGFSYEKSSRQGCNSLEMQIVDPRRLVLAYAMNEENAQKIVARLNELSGSKPVDHEGFALDNIARSLHKELKDCVKLVQKHGNDPQYNRVMNLVQKCNLLFKKGKQDEQAQ